MAELMSKEVACKWASNKNIAFIVNVKESDAAHPFEIFSDKTKIKLNITDFQNQGNNVVAGANIDIKTLNALKAAASYSCVGLLPKYNLEQVKIFGTPDEYGQMLVTKLTINYNPTAPDGTDLRLPWWIGIQNGKGVGEKKGSQTYMKSGTFKSEKSVYINLSADDMYDALIASDRLLDIFVQASKDRVLRAYSAMQE